MAREKTYRSRKHREKTESPSSAKKNRKKTSKRPGLRERRQAENREKPSQARSPRRQAISATDVQEEPAKHKHAARPQANIPVAVAPVENAPIEKIPVEKVLKVRKTVSAAGMFKKDKVDVKKQGIGKSFSPDKITESNLSLEFHGYLEEARMAIDSKMLKSFNEVHEELTNSFAASRRTDEEFFERLHGSTKALVFPLAEEQIKSTFKRDGKQVTEIINMGQRITEFKRNIEKDKERLEEQWKQWEELQNEYIELGLDVFGPEAFGDVQEREERGHGYRWEMELTDLEHGARLEEIMAEVAEFKTEGLKKMMKTEKEMIASSNQETARIVKAIIED